MKIVYDYKDNIELRMSFNKLAKFTFGIDFEAWYQKGFWNDRYICYSYIDEKDNVIANISVNIMDLIIEGKPKNAVQLGTVMTHPDHRGKGLAADLMKTILNKYDKECDLIYLFANKDVLDFYPKFGFERVSETNYSMDTCTLSVSEKTLRKLDISDIDDLILISRLSSSRSPISHLCGVENSEGLLGFYCINVFHDHLYYLEEEDMLIIYEHKDENLHLYDIVGSYDTDLEMLLPHISSEKTKKVIFHFTPDLMNINGQYKTAQSDELLFVKSAKTTLPKEFMFPLTAQA